MSRKVLLTWECIYINDCMLPGLIVNDDIDSKEGNSQSLPQCLRDFPDDIIKETGTTDFTKNWLMIAGDTAIIAQTNVDAVEYAAQLTGNEYEEFDGSARPGMQRRTRERIAGYFGIDEADVKIARRETNGHSSNWMRSYELDNPEKHYG